VKRGSRRKAKFLLFDVALIAVILVFLYSQLGGSDPRLAGGILRDPDFDAGFPDFWVVSVWNQSRIEYSSGYEGGRVSFSLKSEDLGRWSGLGAFQGSKPYGWQASPKGFSPVRVDGGNLTLLWKGRIDGWAAFHGPVSQVNLGVDLWFEAETVEGRKIAEIYVYFYQVGSLTLPLKTPVTVVQRSTLEPRVDQAWVYMMVHWEQLTRGADSSFSLSLDKLVDDLRATSPDHSFRGAPIRLTGVDAIMEVIGGEASFTLDYCGIGEAS